MKSLIIVIAVVLARRNGWTQLSRNSVWITVQMPVDIGNNWQISNDAGREPEIN